MSKKDKNFNKKNDNENKRPDFETAEDIVNGIAGEDEESDEAVNEDKENAEPEGEVSDKESAENEKPESADDRINEWKDKYTRQLAEFENFRKRTEKEKAQMYDMGAKTIAEKILPTIDNFERGLVNAPDDAFAEGMQMVYKQLLKNLEDAGVKAIECVGKEFDPNIHNAVMHEEDDSGEENIVTEELQKGYMYKDTLLRPSMVKVKN